MRKLQFSKTAWTDYENWKKENPKLALRIAELINNILTEPFTGLGKPEALKHNWKGYWSRRITDEHRLIYKVTDDSILIVSCKFHYTK